MKGDWEAEQDCIKEIKKRCASCDREKNGIELDKIIDEFLCGREFIRLADLIHSIKCYRS